MNVIVVPENEEPDTTCNDKRNNSENKAHESRCIENNRRKTEYCGKGIEHRNCLLLI